MLYSDIIRLIKELILLKGIVLRNVLFVEMLIAIVVLI